MAVFFVSQADAESNTITLPTHAEGDQLLLGAFRAGSNGAPGTPTGWTAENTGTGSSTSGAVFSKVAGASEANPTSANATNLCVQAYQATTIAVGASANAYTATGDVDYPALTLEDTTGKSWVVGFGMHRRNDGAVNTAPTGMTNRSYSNGTSNEMAGHDTNGGVTSWSLASVTIGGSTDGNRGFTVEIKETAVAGPSVGELTAARLLGGMPPRALPEVVAY